MKIKVALSLFVLIVASFVVYTTLRFLDKKTKPSDSPDNLVIHMNQRYDSLFLSQQKEIEQLRLREGELTKEIQKLKLNKKNISTKYRPKYEKIIRTADSNQYKLLQELLTEHSRLPITNR